MKYKIVVEHLASGKTYESEYYESTEEQYKLVSIRLLESIGKGGMLDFVDQKGNYVIFHSHILSESITKLVMVK